VEEKDDAYEQLSAFHVPPKNIPLFQSVNTIAVRHGPPSNLDWHQMGAINAALAH
jgi:hypothetical protein